MLVQLFNTSGPGAWHRSQMPRTVSLAIKIDLLSTHIHNRFDRIAYNMIIYLFVAAIVEDAVTSSPRKLSNLLFRPRIYWGGRGKRLFLPQSTC